MLAEDCPPDSKEMLRKSYKLDDDDDLPDYREIIYTLEDEPSEPENVKDEVNSPRASRQTGELLKIVFYVVVY